MRRNTILITLWIAFILILIGSLYDLQISQILYDGESAISLFLAGYGESPALISSWLGAMILFEQAKKKANKQVYFKIVLWMIIPLYIFVETYIYYVDYLVLGILLQLGICFLIAGVIYQGIGKQDEEKRYAFGLLCLMLPVIQIVLCSFLKVIWARPRFRSIRLFEGLEFVDWYQIKTNYRSAFLSQHLLGFNEFTSFPSGHTSNACCFIILTCLPWLNSNFEKHQKLLLGFAYSFTIIVGVSRIILGAHFLTDVIFGFLITLFCFIYLKKKLKIDT